MYFNGLLLYSLHHQQHWTQFLIILMTLFAVWARRLRGSFPTCDSEWREVSVWDNVLCIFLVVRLLLIQWQAIDLQFKVIAHKPGLASSDCFILFLHHSIDDFFKRAASCYVILHRYEIEMRRAESDERNLSPDIVVTSMALKYRSYTSCIARTIFIDAPPVSNDMCTYNVFWIG